MSYLGTLRAGFEAENLGVYFVENADETHFVPNIEKGITLGLSGPESVKYANVVSDNK